MKIDLVVSVRSSIGYREHRASELLAADLSRQMPKISASTEGPHKGINFVEDLMEINLALLRASAMSQQQHLDM